MTDFLAPIGAFLVLWVPYTQLSDGFVDGLPAFDQTSLVRSLSDDLWVVALIYGVLLTTLDYIVHVVMSTIMAWAHTEINLIENEPGRVQLWQQRNAIILSHVGAAMAFCYECVVFAFCAVCELRALVFPPPPLQMSAYDRHLWAMQPVFYAIRGKNSPYHWRDRYFAIHQLFFTSVLACIGGNELKHVSILERATRQDDYYFYHWNSKMRIVRHMLLVTHEDYRSEYDSYGDMPSLLGSDPVGDADYAVDMNWLAPGELDELEAHMLELMGELGIEPDPFFLDIPPVVYATGGTRARPPQTNVRAVSGEKARMPSLIGGAGLEFEDDVSMLEHSSGDSGVSVEDDPIRDYLPMARELSQVPADAVIALLDNIKELMADHPGFSIINALTNFSLQVYFSSRSWQAITLAVKMLVEQLSTVDKRYLDALRAGHFLERFVEVDENEPDVVPAPTRSISAATIKRYALEVRSMITSQRASEWDQFAATDAYMMKTYGCGVGVYSNRSAAIASRALARLGLIAPDALLRNFYFEHVGPWGEDWVATAGEEPSVRRDWFERIAQNAIGAACIGLFLTEGVNKIAPSAMRVLWESLRETRGWAGLLGALKELLINSAGYLRYLITGDKTALEARMTPLERAISKYEDIESALTNMETPVADLTRLHGDLHTHVQEQMRIAEAQKSANASQWAGLWGKVVRQSHDLERLPDSWRKRVPLFLLLVGPPGAGKTMWIKKHMKMFICAFVGRSDPEDGSFDRLWTRRDPKFDTGVTKNTRGALFDDIFGHTEPSAAPTLFPDTLRMLGPDVTFATSAIAEEKGKIPILLDVVASLENSHRTFARWSMNYPAIFRRADLRIEVLYRVGAPTDETFDYSRDVIYIVSTYVTPRNNSGEVGSWEERYRGDGDMAAEYVRRFALERGAFRTAEYIAGSPVEGACRTCSSLECKLGPNAPYEDHRWSVDPLPVVTGAITRDAKLPSRNFKKAHVSGPTHLLPPPITAVGGEHASWRTWAQTVQGVFVPIFYGVLIAMIGGVFGYFNTWFATPLLTRVVDWGAIATFVSGFMVVKPVVTIGRILGDWFDSDRLFYASAFLERGWTGVVGCLGDWAHGRVTRMRHFRGISSQLHKIADTAIAIDHFISSGKYKLFKQVGALIAGFMALYMISRATIGAARAIKTAVVGAPVKSEGDKVSVHSCVDPRVRTEHMVPIVGVSGEKPPMDCDIMRRLERPSRPGFDYSVGAAVVGPNLILTVGHFFDPIPPLTPVTRIEFRKSDQKPPRAHDIPSTNVVRVGEDLVLVRDPHTLVYDDRVGMRCIQQDITALLLYQHCDVSVVEPRTVHVRYHPQSPHTWSTQHAVYGQGAPPVFVGDFPTISTCCGSCLVIPNARGGFDVIGMLVGSDKEKFSVFAAITEAAVIAREHMIMRGRPGMSHQALQATGGLFGKVLADTPPDPRSAMRWASESSFRYLGRYDVGGSKEKCSMVHTRYHDLVETVMQLPDEFIQPVAFMRASETSHGRGVLTAMVEFANNVIEPTERGQYYLNLAADHFINIVRENLRGRLEPLTLAESINGTRLVRGIARSKSVGGLGRSGPKTKHLVLHPCEHWPNGVDLCETSLKMTREVYSAWADGRVFAVPAVLIGKSNEVRKVTKPIMRDISSSPMEFLIAARSHMEPMCQVLRSIEGLGIAIGTDASGPDWGILHATHARINPQRAIDFDFKAFNMNHGVIMKNLLVEVCRRLAAEIFIDGDRASKFVVACEVSGAYVVYVYKGEALLGTFTFPSGTWATGEKQSILSWLLTRACIAGAYSDVDVEVWFPRTGISKDLYSTHGGDDGLGSISERYSPFRGEAFQRFMREEMGYTVTSEADKTKPPQESTLDGAVFYQRSFFHYEGRVFAPLNINSIKKMLLWRDAKSALDVDEHHAVLLERAANEFFMHGPTVYDARNVQLRSIAYATGTSFKFLSFEERLVKYDKHELKFWQHEFEDIGESMGSDCNCARPHFFAVSGEVVSMRTAAAPELSGTTASEPFTAPSSSADGLAVTYSDTVPAVCAEATGRQPRGPIAGAVADDSWLYRMCTYPSFNWTPALYNAFAPFSAIIGNTTIGARLKNTFLMRADIEVTISATVPPTYAGALLCAIGPNTSPAPTLCQMMSMDTVAILDASSCNRVCLRAPIMTTQPWFNWNDASQAPGYGGTQLYIRELQPLIAADGSPTDTPELTIQIRLTKMERFAATAFTAVSGEKARAPSGVISAVIEAARPMTEWPLIGPGVRMISEASGMVASALRFFGFSAPPMPPQLQWMFQRTYPALSTAYATAASMKLSLNPDASMNPSRLDVEGLPGDSLAFANVLRRWGVIGSFTITSASGVGTLLATIPVTPFIQSGSPPPVSVACLTHEMWTGSLEFRIYISSCKFIRGRLAVFSSPNVTVPGSPVTLDALAATDVVYIDLVGSHDVHLVVPWAQVLPWHTFQLLSLTQQRAFSTLTTSGRSDCNGYLCVAVVENLAANTAIVPTLTATVMLRAGEDFRVASPSLVLARSFYAVMGEHESVLGAPDMTRIFHVFEGPRLSHEMLSASGGGETQASFRPLLKRPCFASFYSSASVATGGLFSAYSTSIKGIVKLPQYIAGVGTTYVTTPASVLAACFFSFRGTERHVVFFNSQTVVSTPIQVFISRALQYAGAGSLYSGNGMAAQGQVDPDLFHPILLECGADATTVPTGRVMGPLTVDVPYNDVNWTYLVPDRTNARQSARATVYGYTGAANTLTVANMHAIGDDFQFYGWVGLPALSSITTGNTYPAAYVAW